MQNIITCENICRRFKSGSETINALKNVSITVEKGKLTILRGRSGSGKTTLINILGAIDYPDDGKLYFENKDITKESEEKRGLIRRKKMGFVFQSSGLIPNMTAYENVEFGLRIAGYDKANMKKRAEECLNIVGLGKRMNHLPAELSGGEQQRVAIARAIAHKPAVVFADEPTAALDTNMALTVVKNFKYLIKEEGLTVVMTTHDVGMMEIADCLYTLGDGEIINE